MAVEAAPGDGSAGFEGVKIVRATADVNPPEMPLEAIFFDKTDRKRVTGPIGFAIDGKDETAWTNDIGPGRSNVPRQAVFILDRPLGFAGGAKLKFRLIQNHGGWNSDDNMNNNLGRFRFSVSTNPDMAADPVPRSGPRGAGHRPRSAHAGPDGPGVQPLANDRARVERGQRADRGSCGGSIPPARRN